MMHRAFQMLCGLVLLLCSTLSYADSKGVEDWPAMEIPEGFTLVDQIIAQVQGELVTLYEVDQAVATNLSLSASADTEKNSSRKEALKALIDERLILAEAEKLNLSASPDEVEQHLNMTRQQNGWSLADLEENIGRLGMTLDDYREVTRKEKTKGKVIGVKVGSRVTVTPADVQRVLDADYGGGAFEKEARVSILLRGISPAWTNKEVDEGRRYAQWLQSQAEAAPERFGDLARKFSEHEATRNYGGDLGYFRKGAISVPLLEKAAFELGVGEVSSVLETAQGLMIVTVTDRRDAEVRDLSALKESIFQRLYGEARVQAYRAWIAELRESAFVRTRL